MSKKTTICIIAILAVIILIAPECTNKEREYAKFRENFIDRYFEIVESIDHQSIESIKNLQTEKNEENIEKLKTLLDGIKDKVPDGAKDDYEMLNEWYQGLIFLRDSIDNLGQWDQLTVDEKINILSEFDDIGIRKFDREKNN